jgi:hypothetical protein
MSNIKLIDGVCVDLNRTLSIEVAVHHRNKNDEEFWHLWFVYEMEFNNKGKQLAGRYDYTFFIEGKSIYKTEEEAEKRIKEILTKQNSEVIEI